MGIMDLDRMGMLSPFFILLRQADMDETGSSPPQMEHRFGTSSMRTLTRLVLVIQQGTRWLKLWYFLLLVCRSLLLLRS